MYSIAYLFSSYPHFRDIEKTVPLMHSFRRFLLRSIDRTYLPLQLSPETLALLFNCKSEFHTMLESETDSDSESKSESESKTESKSDCSIHNVRYNQQYKGLYDMKSTPTTSFTSSGCSQETLLKTSGFTVHVLAGGIWPKNLLYATSYSSLVYPKEIKEIKKEFELFFSLSSKSFHSIHGFDSHENEDENDRNDRNDSNENGSDQNSAFSSSINVFILQGAVGQFAELNDEYRKMNCNTDNSEPTFVNKSNGKWIIVYCKESQTWLLKSKVFKESSSRIAFCRVEATYVKRNIFL